MKPHIELVFHRFLNSSLIKKAGVYATFRIVDRVIPFLLLPFITRALAPEEYGIYIIFQALISFVLPFVTLNSDSAVLLNYFHLNSEQFKSYFTNAFMIFFCGVAITWAVFLSAQGSIAGLTKFPAAWLFSIPLICGFQYFTKLALNLWQVKKEAFRYGCFMVSLTLCKNSLMIYFVVFRGAGWEGLIVSQLIGWGLFSVVSVFVFLKNRLIKFDFKRAFIIDNLKVGTPLILHQLGSWSGNLANRLILASLLGAEVTGRYGVGAVFGMIVALVQTAFNDAYVPYLFDKLRNSSTMETKYRLVILTYGYNAALLIFSLMVGLFGYFFVGAFFGAQYEESKIFIMWLVVAWAFDGWYKMHVNYIFYVKKTYLIFITTVSSGISNLILCFVLVKLQGAVGAAQALCFSNFVRFLLSWYIAQRTFPMPWFDRKMLNSMIRHLAKGTAAVK
jgi:O-antigen/teichoic acid export membrane protein